MKILKSIFLLILIVGCNGESNKVESIKIEKEASVQLDTMLIDSTIMVEEVLSPERIKLEELLNNPLDLENYKTEYGTSNNGAAATRDLYYQPDTMGFYYRYMLFHKLRNVLVSHPSESDLFYKFQIVVYKFGETVGDFYDANEELIAIECAMENETLGDLNLYGMENVEVEQKFGEPDRVEEMQSFYVNDNAVLSLHYTLMSDSMNERIKVDWFKLVHINSTFSLNKKIPDYLLNY